jgi:hypothetical protein
MLIIIYALFFSFYSYIARFKRRLDHHLATFIILIDGNGEPCGFSDTVCRALAKSLGENERKYCMWLEGGMNAIAKYAPELLSSHFIIGDLGKEMVSAK